jgi:hypothetical protein
LLYISLLLFISQPKKIYVLWERERGPDLEKREGVVDGWFFFFN